MKRATVWGRRLLGTLAGLIVLAMGVYKMRDVRLHRAFDDALEGAPAGLVVDHVASDSADLVTSNASDEIASDPTRLTLRVLSYNVWALPVPLPGLARGARFPRIPPALSAQGADVIALQEAFDVRFRRFVTSYLAAPHGTHSSTLCERTIARTVRTDCAGGLVTLARFPVVAQYFEPHPAEEKMRRDERMGGKGFMVSTLKTPLGTVHVLNLHLYSGRAPEDEAQRLRQVRRLARALEEYGSLERPLVLLGDLNVVHPSLSTDGVMSPTFSFLVDSLDFVETAPGSPETRLTYDVGINPYAGLWYNRFEGRQIFDYVMVRLPPGFELEVTGARVILTGDETLSDHFGVLTELSISKVDVSDAGPG